MRFAIAREHMDFFYKNYFVEFDNLLSPEEVETLRKEIDNELLQRCHSYGEPLDKISPSSIYMGGHDLWRTNNQIKKIVLRPKLAEIAGALTKVRPLRIGYDQVFRTSEIVRFFSNHEKPLSLNIPLSQMSSLTGVVCGLMLRLSPAEVQGVSSPLSKGVDSSLIPWPSLPGNGIFFAPHISLSLSYFFENPNLYGLLIVYLEDNTIYVLEKNDPHTHALKKLDYGFGDRLRNSTHPIVYHG